MDFPLTESLRALGLTAALARDAAFVLDPLEWPSARLVRLVELHRDAVRVHDGRLEVTAQIAPALLRAGELAVGDWVVCVPDAYGQDWVRGRVPPESHIARRDADGRRHPVVSNVDSALLVMGLDDDFNLRRLERYIALVLGSGVQPVVVLSKADVAAAQPGRVAHCLDAVRQRSGPDVEVLALDGTSPASVAALAPHLLPGRTLVLLGSSGAGKSTLTNTLLGGAVQDTGPVRVSDHRGMHTTTSRSLHCLPGGTCVIDTPGLRTLRPDLDAEALGASFGDIRTLAAQCRFRDCRHAGEPGCAVREGVDADRVRNYQKMLRESRRDSVGPLERREQLSVWKARSKSIRQRAKTGPVDPF
ncbi:MAG: ribosome small subunit-dependent GTPase A [Burkholderiaceae bacterium]